MVWVEQSKHSTIMKGKSYNTYIIAKRKYNVGHVNEKVY